MPIMKKLGLPDKKDLPEQCQSCETRKEYEKVIRILYGQTPSEDLTTCKIVEKAQGIMDELTELRGEINADKSG